MAQGAVETLLAEMNRALFAGDFDAYRRCIGPSLVIIGAESSAVRRTEPEIRRGFERISLLFRAAGWTGYRTELQDPVAMGADGLFVPVFGQPLVDDLPAFPPAEEGFLLREFDGEFRITGLVNIASTRFWSVDGGGAAPLAPDLTEAEAQQTAEGLYAAFRARELGAYLSRLDLPYVFSYQGGEMHISGPGDAQRFLDALTGYGDEYRSYNFELISLRPFGDRLAILRCRVHAETHFGVKRDPWTNFYILRRGRLGWRTALTQAGGVSRLAEPPLMQRTQA